MIVRTLDTYQQVKSLGNNFKYLFILIIQIVVLLFKCMLGIFCAYKDSIIGRCK